MSVLIAPLWHQAIQWHLAYLQMTTVLNALRQWKHSSLVGFMHKDRLVRFRHKINMVWLTRTASIILLDALHVLTTTITTENTGLKHQSPAGKTCVLLTQTAVSGERALIYDFVIIILYK